VWVTATSTDFGGSPSGAWLAVSYAVLLIIGVAQSYVDITTHRVYVAVTRFAGAWMAVMLGAHALLFGEATAIVRMVVAAAVMWVGFRLLARGADDGLGAGDVRLAPVIGMALGYLSYGSLIAGVTAMTAIGAIWAIIAMLRHGLRARVPYVPAMYGGLVFALVTQG
jgi:leader peptidase (prepilin peptidase) / N-methyltransferase